MESLLVGVGTSDLTVRWLVVYPLDSGLGNRRAGTGAYGAGLSICKLVFGVGGLGLGKVSVMSLERTSSKG